MSSLSQHVRSRHRLADEVPCLSQARDKPAKVMCISRIFAINIHSIGSWSCCCCSMSGYLQDVEMLMSTTFPVALRAWENPRPTRTDAGLLCQGNHACVRWLSIMTSWFLLFQETSRADYSICDVTTTMEARNSLKTWENPAISLSRVGLVCAYIPPLCLDYPISIPGHGYGKPHKPLSTNCMVFVCLSLVIKHWQWRRDHMAHRQFRQIMTPQSAIRRGRGSILWLPGSLPMWEGRPLNGLSPCPNVGRVPLPTVAPVAVRPSTKVMAARTISKKIRGSDALPSEVQTSFLSQWMRTISRQLMRQSPRLHPPWGKWVPDR